VVTKATLSHLFRLAKKNLLKRRGVAAIISPEEVVLD
jgi:hypothetical protein